MTLQRESIFIIIIICIFIYSLSPETIITGFILVTYDRFNCVLHKCKLITGRTSYFPFCILSMCITIVYKFTPLALTVMQRMTNNFGKKITLK